MGGRSGPSGPWQLLLPEPPDHNPRVRRFLGSISKLSRPCLLQEDPNLEIEGLVMWEPEDPDPKVGSNHIVGMDLSVPLYEREAIDRLTKG